MVSARIHDYGLELTLCRARHNVIYSGYRIIPSMYANRRAGRQTVTAARHNPVRPSTMACE